MLKELAEKLNQSADATGCSDDLIVVGRAELQAMIAAVGVTPAFECATSVPMKSEDIFFVEWVWSDPIETYNSNKCFMNSEEAKRLEDLLQDISEEYGDFDAVNVFKAKAAPGDTVLENMDALIAELRKTFDGIPYDYAVEAIDKFTAGVTPAP